MGDATGAPRQAAAEALAAPAALAGEEGLPSERRRDWQNLRQRAVSAAILLPAALLCIWLGAEAWTALVAAASAILAWEWVRLCGFSTLRLPGSALPLAVLGAGTLAVGGAYLAALLLLAGGAAAAAWLGAAAGPGRRRPTASAGWLAFGVIHIGLAGIALIHLRGDAAAGLANVIFLFAVVWASDIGAYAFGRTIGGAKLFPAISPNKTWAGAAGGLLSAVTTGMVAAYVFDGWHATGIAGLVAAVLGVLTQAGDLFESWIKRRFHVKDTSSLIPGHGGLLDRLDGLLAAAPAAGVLGALLGPGAMLWAMTCP
jgi:phosphatidate cytidylyltransferase